MTPTMDPATLRAMVTRNPPSGVRVISGSTPVISFGDASQARVATLGINPSAREFLDSAGNWLSEARLTTLADLGISSLAEATPAEAGRVLEGCAAYFDRNPYWTWFRPLDRLLASAVGASYKDGSACHLDLVQWATNPVWGKLSADERETLLTEDLPYLRRQLTHLNIRLVLLNGRTVLDHVTTTGLVDLTEVGTMTYHANGATTRLYEGNNEGVTYLGWSVNLQSGRGANTDWFREKLAEWIRGRTNISSQDAQRPRVLSSKTDLRNALADWFENTDEPTIGDVSTFGRRPWLTLSLGGVNVILNADTTRAAVRAFLDTDPTRPWHVIANRNGVINKVTFEPDLPPVRGWYCYTDRPLDTRRSL